MAVTVGIAALGFCPSFTKISRVQQSSDHFSSLSVKTNRTFGSRSDLIQDNAGVSRASGKDLARSSSEFNGYVPDAEFYKVEAIVRPWRVTKISAALLEIGIRGVTVSDVRGFGAQGVSIERQAGSEFSEDNFVAKVKMEIVVCKNQVEHVIETIVQEARTGEIGDGKIFLIPVVDVIRVRTGERGEKAEKMVGGRGDLIATNVE